MEACMRLYVPQRVGLTEPCMLLRERDREREGGERERERSGGGREDWFALWLKRWSNAEITLIPKQQL